MKLLFTIPALCFTTLVFSQNLVPNSTGSFTFTPPDSIDRPSLEVFYHIPEGDITSMPILMSFHGANRNGDDYRDYWIDMANENEFMVFAPAFSSDNYPGLGDNYIMSNIFDDGDNPSLATYNDKNEWTCAVLDPLFDHIVADISGTQETYGAWGHSAGAQFLHRLMMYLPDNKISIAVASNAGWYTVPENSVRFPYGISGGQLPTSDLTTAFSKNLIIHLGQDDTSPSTASGGPRNNNTVNNQQGLTRLERGRYFFSRSQVVAEDLGVAFNWERFEIAGIGHDGQLMANDAMQYLVPLLVSTENVESSTFINMFPNPTSGVVNFSGYADYPFKVFVFNITGQQVMSKVIETDQLDLSDLTAGMYSFRIVTHDGDMINKKLIVK